MTTDALRDEPLLHLFDTLLQHQLRNAGAEVAAAIAHAMGTPLNVISGRAELIRQDPSSALAQVTRIEEQVRKLATGLRQLVDYLAVPEGFAPASERNVLLGSVSAAESPSGPATMQSAFAEPAGSGEKAPESLETLVRAVSVLTDLVTLSKPIADAHGSELEVDGSALHDAIVDRWHVLSTLNTLVSSAVKHAGGMAVSHRTSTGTERSESGKPEPSRPRVVLTASVASGLVVFELSVPGLEAMEGWHLEHFQVRPPPTQKAELYRALSICAAVVRGRGGKLQVLAQPAGEGATIRFSCKLESS